MPQRFASLLPEINSFVSIDKYMKLFSNDIKGENPMDKNTFDYLYFASKLLPKGLQIESKTCSNMHFFPLHSNVFSILLPPSIPSALISSALLTS